MAARTRTPQNSKRDRAAKRINTVTGQQYVFVRGSARILTSAFPA